MGHRGALRACGKIRQSVLINADDLCTRMLARMRKLPDITTGWRCPSAALRFILPKRLAHGRLTVPDAIQTNVHNYPPTYPLWCGRPVKYLEHHKIMGVWHESSKKSTISGTRLDSPKKVFLPLQALDALRLTSKRQAVQITSTAFCGRMWLQARPVAVS